MGYRRYRRSGASIEADEDRPTVRRFEVCVPGARTDEEADTTLDRGRRLRYANSSAIKDSQQSQCVPDRSPSWRARLVSVPPSREPS
jgi:hypothetical protein